MITRIEKDLYFVAGVHFKGAFHINTYDIMLSMLIETDCPKQQQVAMERLDFFMKEIVTNSIFIDEEKEEEIQKYAAAGLNIITLPDEPYDQVVALALLLKLNAIMENRIKITDMIIGSLLGDGIRYPIVVETAENAKIMLGNNWWHNNDTETTNKCDFLFGQPNNVVKLFDDSVWALYNLSWKDKPKNALT